MVWFFRLCIIRFQSCFGENLIYGLMLLSHSKSEHVRMTRDGLVLAQNGEFGNAAHRVRPAALGPGIQL